MVYLFACSTYMVETLGELEAFTYYEGAMQDENGWSFFQSVYFVMVTISTVGYGDYSPETVIGRGLTSVYILGGVGFFSITINDTIAMVDYLRAGKGSYASTRGTPHVVLVGDLAP